MGVYTPLSGSCVIWCFRLTSENVIISQTAHRLIEKSHILKILYKSQWSCGTEEMRFCMKTIDKWRQALRTGGLEVASLTTDATLDLNIPAIQTELCFLWIFVICPYCLSRRFHAALRHKGKTVQTRTQELGQIIGENLTALWNLEKSSCLHQYWHYVGRGQYTLDTDGCDKKAGWLLL